MFHVSAQGADFYFIAIERVRTESYRTGYFKSVSKEQFVKQLDGILKDVEKEKGVWSRLGSVVESKSGPITHRGDEDSISTQIWERMKMAKNTD